MKFEMRRAHGGVRVTGSIPAAQNHPLSIFPISVAMAWTPKLNCHADSQDSRRPISKPCSLELSFIVLDYEVGGGSNPLAPRCLRADGPPDSQPALSLETK